MTEPQAKKPRMEETYKLFYWPGVPGRGEPARLAFEETGTAYEDVCQKHSDGVKTLIGKLSNPGGDNLPNFAPPMLQHGDLVISQAPNIMLYLGEKLGLAGETAASKYHVNQLFLTASDLQNEAHDTHHPVSTTDYYEDQKDAALVAAKDFRKTRIPKYLKHFEAVLTKNEKHTKKEDGWLVGESLTYADLMLYYVIDGVKYAFPKRMETLLPDYPKVLALYERVKNRPNIAAYLASDRRMKYGNGIYRYYEELDGES